MYVAFSKNTESHPCSPPLGVGFQMFLAHGILCAPFAEHPNIAQTMIHRDGGSRRLT